MEESIKRKRWTPSEESVLIEQVKAFPKDLKKAFTVTSKLIGRTYFGVKYRWYEVTAEKIKEREEKSKVSFWKKFLKLFHIK